MNDSLFEQISGVIEKENQRIILAHWKEVFTKHFPDESPTSDNLDINLQACKNLLLKQHTEIAELKKKLSEK